MDFSQTCISTSPMYVLPVILFSARKTLECIYEMLLHYRLIVAITWTLSYDLDKLLDTQSIDVSLCSESFKKL